MSGFRVDGSPITNPETGEVTTFFNPGDPNDDTGPGDGVWVDADDYRSGDRSFLMSSGPFSMAPGDSQEIVFAIIIAQGEDALDSVTRLKEAARLLHDVYTTTFPDLYPPWPTPLVAATPLKEAIILNWDDGVNVSETFQVTDVTDRLPIPAAFDTTWTTMVIPVIDTLSTDPLVLDTTYTWEQAIVAIDTTFRGEPTTFTFQGYNVYQLETASGQGAIERIATFDLIDGVTDIKDRVLHPAVGEYVDIRVQFGSDSGIRRSLLIEADELGGDIPLKINRAYYFAVTAYGYNPYGFPRTLESLLQVITVRPQAHNTLEPVTEADRSTIQAVHSTGRSDGSVTVKVVDPLAITGDEYEVTFHNNPYSSAMVWDLTNTTTGALLVDGNPIQSGVDWETGWELGVEAGPIVDGLQVQVTTPPNGFKDFIVTENAGGVLATPARASARWQQYPGIIDPEEDYSVDQQLDRSNWFISTSNGSNIAYEDFLGYVTRYSGGYGNPDGGMQYLIPDDFEFRFTEDGSKMLSWWADDQPMVNTTLEIWNIGDVNDPSDDFQLMAIFNDDDENGEWNLYQDDSPLSGGSNDPYMETFYVLEHAGREPGSTGYEAMVAALTADPLASGADIWKTGPGLPLSVDGQITRVVLLNMTFVQWNGGDVTDTTWPANVTSMVPEEGTVFRMETTKPNALSDVFTFSTDSLKATTLALDIDAVNVWPNPYFAFNPEERTPTQRIVMFTNLPETAIIRIFNLGGLLVKILRHDDGSQYETWDLRNLDGRLVAAGMYIVHIQTPYGDKVLKLAVVQPKN